MRIKTNILKYESSILTSSEWSQTEEVEVEKITFVKFYTIWKLRLFNPSTKFRTSFPLGLHNTAAEADHNYSSAHAIRLVQNDQYEPWKLAVPELDSSAIFDQY